MPICNHVLVSNVSVLAVKTAAIPKLVTFGEFCSWLDWQAAVWARTDKVTPNRLHWDDHKRKADRD